MTTSFIISKLEPSLLSNSNPYFISIAWIVSSSIFTTYFTTLFLKYPQFSPNAYSFLTRRTKEGASLSTRYNALSADTKAMSRTNGSTASLDRPTLLTLLRFGGSFLIGLLLRADLGRIPTLALQTVVNMRYFIASAMFLFVANYCNSISLNRLGVPLTYTSKCAIPLFTVLLVLFLEGPQALPNAVALASLALVAFGIAAASFNSPSFDTLGFAAAIISTTAQAALNIESKRAMILSHTSGVDAQRTMVAVAFIITAALSLAKIVSNFLSLPENQTNGQPPTVNSSTPSNSSNTVCPPFSLALFTVAAYHVEYSLSFMFVRLVSPLTYGTCDAIRRLIIIIAGKFSLLFYTSKQCSVIFVIIPHCFFLLLLKNRKANVWWPNVFNN
jgi:hypothetical protein